MPSYNIIMNTAIKSTTLSNVKPYPLSAAERIHEIAANFELEGMPLTKQDIQSLWDVENGKITAEKLRQKIISNYK